MNNGTTFETETGRGRSVAKRRCTAAVLGLVTMAMAAWLVAQPAGATPTVTSVGGGAFGEQIRSLLVNSGPVPSVTLPATGGSFSTNLASVNIPGLLTTGVLNVSTSGATGPAGFAASAASVADPVVAGGLVVATAVTSACRTDATGSIGSSGVVDALVAGIPVLVNPGPNTIISVPGVATVILNEQIVTPIGITVNAVHVRLLGLIPLLTTDIIVSQSRCQARVVDVTTTTTVAPTTTTLATTRNRPPTTTTTRPPTTTTTCHGPC